MHKWIERKFTHFTLSASKVSNNTSWRMKVFFFLLSLSFLLYCFYLFSSYFYICCLHLFSARVNTWPHSRQNNCLLPSRVMRRAGGEEKGCKCTNDRYFCCLLRDVSFSLCRVSQSNQLTSIVSSVTIYINSHEERRGKVNTQWVATWTYYKVSSEMTFSPRLAEFFR